MPQPAQQQQVVDQVKVQIDRQVKDGADTIKVQLKPADLGKIEIKLELGQDGRVQAMVTADKAETLKMLQQDARGLERALQDAGLKADAGSLSFNLRGEQQQQAAQDTPGRSGRGRGRLAGGVDEAGGRPLGLDLTDSAAPPHRPGVRGGVDISV